MIRYRSVIRNPQRVSPVGMYKRRLIAIIVSVFALAGSVNAQTPSPSVSTGFGVDTTITDVRNIVSLVRAYLAKPDTTARSRGLWTTSTEFDRRVGDATLFQAYEGFPATVVGVLSTPDEGVYVVRMLYARADSTGAAAPLALQRLYAIRDPSARFGFKLASALPRVTRHWQQRSAGPITFVYAPGQSPNQARIDSVARFVDSVARMFGVPQPPHLDVIVGQSMDDVLRAIGLDFYPEPSGPGQRSGGRNLGSILLVGNPQIGEAYYHEFVHAILGPHIRAGTRLLSEGVATWLGGSRGRSAREVYAAVRQYQRADSTLSLSRLYRTGFEDDDPLRQSDLIYGSGALIANAVYQKRGITGLRDLYQAGGDAESMLRTISTALGLPPNDPGALDRWWRAEAARAATLP
ncbi:MAG: hypothetical protein ACJ8AK_06750 [Gemmatimonadaceae bacterium]